MARLHLVERSRNEMEWGRGEKGREEKEKVKDLKGIPKRLVVFMSFI